MRLAPKIFKIDSNVIINAAMKRGHFKIFLGIHQADDLPVQINPFNEEKYVD